METRKRPQLTDSDCRKFVKAMRDFGYPKLTLEEVEKVAAQVAEGTHSNTNVIVVMMCKFIDDALDANSHG